MAKLTADDAAGDFGVSCHRRGHRRGREPGKRRRRQGSAYASTRATAAPRTADGQIDGLRRRSGRLLAGPWRSATAPSWPELLGRRQRSRAYRLSPQPTPTPQPTVSPQPTSIALGSDAATRRVSSPCSSPPVSLSSRARPRAARNSRASRTPSRPRVHSLVS